MKLLFCPECFDVRKLRFRHTVCQCRKSWGQYVDDLNAIIGGKAIPIGFKNSSLAQAIRTQPDEGMGADFVAFVIPKCCPTIEVEE